MESALMHLERLIGNYQLLTLVLVLVIMLMLAWDRSSPESSVNASTT